MNKVGIISQTMSRKISHMMFFLSVLVVYIHTYDNTLTEATFREEQAIEDFISQGFSRIAVPLFFMMSGYLHFSRPSLSTSALAQQIPKKITALAIPYLAWNILYTIFLFGTRMMAGQSVRVDNWIVFLLKAVFLYENNGAFWYVFQLLILFALAPGLYNLYKKKHVGILMFICFFAMYLFIKERTKFFLLPGILFFSLGAMTALHGRHIVDQEYQQERIKKIGPRMAAGVFAILMLWRVQLMDLNENISDLRDTVPYRLFEFAAPIAFWFASDIVDFSKLSVKAWEKKSFFIYASHGIVLSAFNVVSKKLIPSTPIWRMIVYLTEPLIVVTVIVFIATVMKKYFPKTYRMLSGNR